MSVGIIVHGDNHFIVKGPAPDRHLARELVRSWTLIRIGAGTLPELGQWRICTREYRENLEWAVIVPGEGQRNPAVQQLLNELEQRGVVPMLF